MFGSSAVPADQALFVGSSSQSQHSVFAHAGDDPLRNRPFGFNQSEFSKKKTIEFPELLDPCPPVLIAQ